MGNKKGIKMIVAVVERSHGKALAKFLTTQGILSIISVRQ